MSIAKRSPKNLLTSNPNTKPIENYSIWIVLKRSFSINLTMRMMTSCRNSWKKKRKNNRSKNSRKSKRSNPPKLKSYLRLKRPSLTTMNQRHNFKYKRKRPQKITLVFQAQDLNKTSLTNQCNTSIRKFKQKKWAKTWILTKRRIRPKMNNYNFPITITLPIRIKSSQLEYWLGKEIHRR